MMIALADLIGVVRTGSDPLSVPEGAAAELFSSVLADLVDPGGPDAGPELSDDILGMQEGVAPVAPETGAGGGFQVQTLASAEIPVGIDLGSSPKFEEGDQGQGPQKTVDTPDLRPDGAIRTAWHAKVSVPLATESGLPARPLGDLASGGSAAAPQLKATTEPVAEAVRSIFSSNVELVGRSEPRLPTFEDTGHPSGPRHASDSLRGTETVLTPQRASSRGAAAEAVDHMPGTPLPTPPTVSETGSKASAKRSLVETEKTPTETNPAPVSALSGQDGASLVIAPGAPTEIVRRAVDPLSEDTLPAKVILGADDQTSPARPEDMTSATAAKTDEPPDARRHIRRNPATVTETARAEMIVSRLFSEASGNTPPPTEKTAHAVSGVMHDVGVTISQLGTNRTDSMTPDKAAPSQTLPIRDVEGAQIGSADGAQFTESHAADRPADPLSDRQKEHLTVAPSTPAASSIVGNEAERPAASPEQLSVKGPVAPEAVEQASGPQAHPNPARQIAAEIQLQPNAQRIEVVLQPEELGRVEIRLLPDGDTLQVQILSQRDETAALVRRYHADLAAELRGLGYTSVGFDFGSGQHHPRQGDPPSRGISPASPPPSETDTGHPNSRRPLPSDRLNLRL